MCLHSSTSILGFDEHSANQHSLTGPDGSTEAYLHQGCLPTAIGDVAPESNVQDLTLNGLFGEEIKELVVGHRRPGQWDSNVLVRRKALIKLQGVLHLQMGGSAKMRQSHSSGGNPCRVQPQLQCVKLIEVDVREVAHLA